MPQFVKFPEQNKVDFKVGYITLYGSTGKEYRSKALYVPDYGWVPCSRRLCGDFTTESTKLQLVISSAEDVCRPVTSDIWITRAPEKLDLSFSI